jgi:type IV pilus assembly protein PilC
LVAMGEKTGNLASSFASIVDDLKWTIDIKRKTKKATNGPLFGLFMVVVVMAVMTSIVVPKVTGFLKSQQLKLPGTTIALMNFSDFFQNYWYLVILTPVAIFIAIKIMQRSEHLAIKIDHLKLKIPVIGGISNKIDAAKFCQFFSMTFKSGLGVLECLDASSFAINNKAIRYSIIDVKHQVSDGKSLAKALASSGYFPVLVLRMFKVGEDTGNMEGALDNIKFFYDREINDSIDRLVAMIQPTLTIIMGGMIAWITIAVFGPVYGTFSQIR